MSENLTIDNFRVSGIPNNNIYSIGLADTLVTIHSQQIRALCLGKLLDEYVNSNSLLTRENVCIIGGGIAGLTVALALAKYGWRDINIIERLPDLLGLQNGCDTRWVHPHIINWPDIGSDSIFSDSGDLSWTASTASNVAYEIEQKWMKHINTIINKTPGHNGRPVKIISTHVGVSYIHGTIEPNRCSIEWVRDSRIRHLGFKGSTVKNSDIKDYKHIILATGFGIEQNSKNSYWRNEDIGQIHIDGIQKGYLISGLGDGAISDLIRLTTKNFRPDRAITQISQINSLKDNLMDIKNDKNHQKDLMSLLIKERNKTKNESKEKWNRLLKYFEQMKREDTKVFLHHNSNDGFSSAFNKSPASFLNRFLLFILYQNGMFQYIETPHLKNSRHTSQSTTFDYIKKFTENHDIKPENIIIRHGANRIDIVKNIFPKIRRPIFKEQPYNVCFQFYKNSIKDKEKINLLY